MGLTSATQPSELTSVYTMELLWLISYVASYTQVWGQHKQSSQVASDQGMGLNNRVISSVAPYIEMELTSAIQPSYLTSDYAMGLPWLISSVASYTGMGLTSAIQPVTSDQEMGWISPCMRPSSPLWIPKGWLPEKMQFLQRKWDHRIENIKESEKRFY